MSEYGVFLSDCRGSIIWAGTNVRVDTCRLCITETYTRWASLTGLSEVSGLTIHGPADPGRRVATVSVSLAGWEPIDLGAVLDSTFGICVRPGPHCAPLAHRTLGTYPQGTVWLSPGPFTTEYDIDRAIAALSALGGP